MERILPFYGLRYNTGKAGEITDLIAPPYDVVSDKERDFLVEKNKYNIFSLELPKTIDNTDPFEFSKKQFQEWLDGEILSKEPKACIYPYNISYETHDNKLERKGFIALLRLEDWAKGIVKPHERTFDKVTVNRLNLLKETRANLSPIFMLYKTDKNIASVIDKNKGQELFSVDDSLKNCHKFYKIDDENIIKKAQEGLSNAFFYIADGHHRYTTALKYFNDSNGASSAYIMTYLVDTSDDGLVILPTHRILKLDNAFPEIPAEFSEVIKNETIRLSDTDPSSVIGLINERVSGNHFKYITIFNPMEKSLCFWKIDIQKANSLNFNGSQRPLFSLDVFWLEEIIFKKILKKSAQEMKESGELTFVSNGISAFNETDDNKILFYINPASVDDVINISDKGLLMPQKSTFFYPKILTGLVINSFDHSFINIT
jgi:uncharacterized protein (DUF1015 family)